MDHIFQKYKDKLPIALIMLVAVLTRFWYFWELPFVPDEFSAFFRTQFGSFSELIEKGVYPDGHPAGIQVFIYYWGQLFGFSELSLKTPFLLMGTASVALIYKIGKNWFGNTAGLFSAAVAAVMQYTIFYSQIARPYSSGLFVSLIMVLFWSNLVFSPHKYFLKNAISYVLSASLCAYNHHFSLLFAAVVGLSGLFYVRKEYFGKYLLCGFAIFALYIPHLRIFLYQLKVGGVEAWLGKPGNDFIFQYIWYLFNYSSLFILSVGLLLAYSLFRKSNREIMPFYILSVIWFLTPFLIGFFYSKYVNSVLQYSVLLFSFPFLLYLIFGRIQELPNRLNFVIVVGILIIGLSSLIFERRHYQLFYNSAYENILQDQNTARDEFGNKLVSFIHSNKRIANYYIDKDALDSCFYYDDRFRTLLDFNAFLRDSTNETSQLFFGYIDDLDPIMVTTILQYFPKIEMHKLYMGGETYRFSKSEDLSPEIKSIASCNFEPNFVSNPSIIPENLVDTLSYSGSYSYLMNESMEWSPSFSFEIDSLGIDKFDIVEVSVKAKLLSNLGSVLLVVSIEKDNRSIVWKGIPFQTFFSSSEVSAEWKTVLNATEIYIPIQKIRNSQLNIYVWNEGRSTFLIDDFQIRIRKGNRFKYGLSEQF